MSIGIPRQSRRMLLGAGLGALAAAVAGTLGRALPASAHDPDDVQVGGSSLYAGQTTLTNNSSNGPAALAGISSTASTLGVGVAGSSLGGGTGVIGHSASGTGVIGTSDSGYGVDGYSASSSLPGVLAVSGGNNAGLQGYSGPGDPPASPAKTGVQGYADKDAGSVGVRGDSSTGRGGVYGGKLAQLRLSPSTATSHPGSGQAGDLFVDKSKRLWFCKGGTTWKQLA